MDNPNTDTNTKRCDRCGFVAEDIKKLIAHLRDGASCPPLHSTLAHADLIERLVAIDNLSCSFCHRLFSRPGGKTLHTKHCKLNPERVDRKTGAHTTNVASVNGNGNANANGASTSASASTSSTTRTKTNGGSSKYKHLHPFCSDVDIEDCGIERKNILRYALGNEQGIIDLFVDLHSRDKHNNIKWSQNKLILYDGHGWVELNDGLLQTHLWMLYSIIEEVWCDYEMEVRLGTSDVVYDDETVARVNNFLYELIVDDESVLLYCADLLAAYLEGVK